MQQHGSIVSKLEVVSRNAQVVVWTALAKPRGSDLQLVLVLIQGSEELVQGQELAKGVEAQQL